MSYTPPKGGFKKKGVQKAPTTELLLEHFAERGWAAVRITENYSFDVARVHLHRIAKNYGVGPIATYRDGDIVVGRKLGFKGRIKLTASNQAVTIH